MHLRVMPAEKYKISNVESPIPTPHSSAIQGEAPNAIANKYPPIIANKNTVIPPNPVKEL